MTLSPIPSQAPERRNQLPPHDQERSQSECLLDSKNGFSQKAVLTEPTKAPSVGLVSTFS